VSNNLIWCECKKWQEWINKQEIKLGQPMLKNDKSSALLDLNERCEFVTYAHPKLRGFDPDKVRYYLPVSLNQVCKFLNDKFKFRAIMIQHEKNNVHITIMNNDKKEAESHGKGWYEATTKLVKEVFNV
jgi:hypothetical protein